MKEYEGKYHSGRCCIVGTRRADKKSVTYTCKITFSDIRSEIGKEFTSVKSKFNEDWREL